MADCRHDALVHSPANPIPNGSGMLCFRCQRQLSNDEFDINEWGYSNTHGVYLKFVKVDGENYFELYDRDGQQLLFNTI